MRDFNDVTNGIMNSVHNQLDEELSLDRSG